MFQKLTFSLLQASQLHQQGLYLLCLRTDFPPIQALSKPQLLFFAQLTQTVAKNEFLVQDIKDFLPYAVSFAF